MVFGGFGRIGGCDGFHGFGGFRGFGEFLGLPLHAGEQLVLCPDHTSHEENGLVE